MAHEKKTRSIDMYIDRTVLNVRTLTSKLECRRSEVMPRRDWKPQASTSRFCKATTSILLPFHHPTSLVLSSSILDALGKVWYLYPSIQVWIRNQDRLEPRIGKKLIIHDANHPIPSRASTSSRTNTWTYIDIDIVNGQDGRQGASKLHCPGLFWNYYRMRATTAQP